MVWSMISGADHQGKGARFLLALSLVFCVALLPVNAYAEEEVEEPNPTVYVSGTEAGANDAVTVPVGTTDTQALGEISNKLDKLEEVNTSLGDVKSSIDGVNGKLDTLLLESAEPTIEPVEMVAAANNTVTFTAYANVLPTSTYATYARQIVPKMGWKDDYVFMQDSSSSYVLFYGDIDFASAGTFSGTGCDYIRWYFSGNSAGYVVQRGNADVVANVGNYMVCSSLDKYPLLDDGVTLFRQEVCFYALVAVIVYSLHCALSFTLRMRATAVSE